MNPNITLFYYESIGPRPPHLSAVDEDAEIISGMTGLPISTMRHRDNYIPVTQFPQSMLTETLVKLLTVGHTVTIKRAE